MKNFQVVLMAPDEQSGEDVTVANVADEAAARAAVLARFSVQSEAELLEQIGMNIASVTVL